MASKFNNLTELNTYLDKMENRVLLLEKENQALKESLEGMTGENKALVNFIREMMPKTTMLSKSFFLRAFSVWGHYFVAQLIISLGLALIIFVLSLLFLGGIGGLLNADFSGLMSSLSFLS